MHDTPHLVVSISSHGFGHVSQTAPVLNLLQRRMPGLRLTVRSSVPLSHLRSRIHAPFTHLPSEGDIGMAMSSSVNILVEESRAAYRAYHANWHRRVADEARLLHDLKANFVLSNTGYLALAGAQQAGIPNAALCSLNWFDIYRHYCGTDDVAMQILESYARADAFLRIAPGMEMEYLQNVVSVPPVAEAGVNRRSMLERHLGLAKQEKLVLISLGGIADRLPVEDWPRLEGVRWLVQSHWGIVRPDAIAIESLPLDFSDLLASCDAMICKPGYGSFVEAACSGVPVLYLFRADWPETPALTAWLERHAVCCGISRAALEQGNIASLLDEMWNSPRPPLPAAEGSAQAAAYLAAQLGR